MIVSVLWFLLTVPWVGLQYVIVVFPDHTHLRFIVSDARFQIRKLFASKFGTSCVKAFSQSPHSMIVSDALQYFLQRQDNEYDQICFF